MILRWIDPLGDAFEIMSDFDTPPSDIIIRIVSSCILLGKYKYVYKRMEGEIAIYVYAGEIN